MKYHMTLNTIFSVGVQWTSLRRHREISLIHHSKTRCSTTSCHKVAKVEDQSHTSSIPSKKVKFGDTYWREVGEEWSGVALSLGGDRLGERSCPPWGLKEPTWGPPHHLCALELYFGIHHLFELYIYKVLVPHMWLSRWPAGGWHVVTTTFMCLPLSFSFQRHSPRTL
jgi:hypothetical protein